MYDLQFAQSISNPQECQGCSNVRNSRHMQTRQIGSY